MTVIGITGGIGSGKSTAVKRIKQRGYTVIDADIVSREIMEKDSPVLSKLCEVFGDDIIMSDGELDRKLLASRAFKDDQSKKILDEITHGEIISRIVKRTEDLLKGGEKLIFIDAALMYEAGLDKKTDEVWLIRTSDDVRLARVMERDSATKNEVIARMSKQMPETEKESLADVVIRNDGTVEELSKKIDKEIDKRLR